MSLALALLSLSLCRCPSLRGSISQLCLPDHSYKIYILSAYLHTSVVLGYKTVCYGRAEREEEEEIVTIVL